MSHLGTPDTFVAIDFETAAGRRDSACAVGLAACCGGRIVLTRTYLIRPPTERFTFTDLHGIDWENVRHAPTFADLWPTLRGWFGGVAFLAAHNSAFDRSVLHACCARYRIPPPRVKFTCTVQLARAQWGIQPTRLPDVCRRLRIPLIHHDAGADAVACASIVLAAQAEGWGRGRRRRHRRKPRGGRAIRGKPDALSPLPYNARVFHPPRRNASTPTAAISVWHTATVTKTPLGPRPAGPASVQASGSCTTQ